MDITITGRRSPVDDKARKYIEDKIQKIVRLHDRLSSAHVVLDLDHGRHQAEVTVNGARGAVFTAHAEGAELRLAIDAVEEKLEHQIRAWKDRLVDHRPS